jgi:membrane protease YdiL (CAAX protease family)
MPILAATPTPDPRTEAIFATGCLLVGLAFGLALRLVRPARVSSPDRVPSTVSAWPLVAVLGVGLLCWYVIPVTYFSIQQARLMARHGPEARIDPAHLSVSDLAFLATVPPVCGMVALLVGDAGLRRRFGIHLGYGVRRLGKGLLFGVLGSLCVVPLVDGSMILVEWAYRAAGYEHPKEHDLLRALGESNDRMTEAVLIVGAAVLAPVFEELLFRGHVQTLLRSGMARLRREVRAPEASGQEGGLAADGSASPQAAEIPVSTSWVAILATAVLFALVHPMWTWPAIFLLAVCLGYAYERTGNLWVPVVIHAVFNSTQTLIYLYAGSGGVN